MAQAARTLREFDRLLAAHGLTLREFAAHSDRTIEAARRAGTSEPTRALRSQLVRARVAKQRLAVFLAGDNTVLPPVTGAWVRLEMARLGLTVREVAAFAQVSMAYVRQVRERGGPWDWPLLLAKCAARREGAKEAA